MNKNFKYIFLYISVLLFTTFTSCEKVIELNLNEANQHVVIEAVLTDSLGYNFVKISKTGKLSDTSSIVAVKNAEVIVSDQNMNEYIFEEIYDGYYSNADFKGQQNTVYNLSVTTEDKHFTSTSKMPENVKVDSVNFYMFPVENSDEFVFLANMFYTDPVFDGNFYRIKTYINDQMGSESGMNIFSDEYINGTMSAFSYYSEDLIFGDTVVFHLLNTDENNYEYWRLLYMNSSMGIISTPGNPTTNITGENVTGYFGAYSLSVDTLIILPLF